MTEQVFILGGARTPMTEYTGALKDVSALELGAIASRAAFAEDRRQAGMDRPRRVRQRAADEQRRDLRRAARGAQGRRADRSARAHRQPPVRVRHPGGRQRRADDPARRGGHRADRRHGEHEPGAARDSRPAVRPAARTRASSRTTSTKRCSIRTAACSWRRRRRSAPRSTTSRATSRTSTRFAASRPPRKAWADGHVQGRGRRPSNSRRRKGVTVVDRDDHLRPDTTLEGLAKLPAAFSKDGTVTAGNASGIVDGGAALILASARRGEGQAPDADRAARRVGGRRRRSVVHGHGPGAGDAPGARSAPA